MTLSNIMKRHVVRVGGCTCYSTKGGSSCDAACAILFLRIKRKKFSCIQNNDGTVAFWHRARYNMKVLSRDCLFRVVPCVPPTFVKIYSIYLVSARRRWHALPNTRSRSVHLHLIFVHMFRVAYAWKWWRQRRRVKRKLRAAGLVSFSYIRSCARRFISRERRRRATPRVLRRYICNDTWSEFCEQSHFFLRSVYSEHFDAHTKQNGL